MKINMNYVSFYVSIYDEYERTNINKIKNSSSEAASFDHLSTDCRISYLFKVIV